MNKIDAQYWLNYLLSSGVLYAIAWRLSRRWFWRVENFFFKWLLRLVLLAAVVGVVWVVMN